MKRKYYSVEDAAKIVGCSANDLIHFGAIGKLRLRALLPGCDATETVWDSDPEEEFLACQQFQEKPSDAWLLGPYELGKFAIRLIEAKSDAQVRSVYGSTDGIAPIVFTLVTPIPANEIQLVVMADDLNKFNLHAEEDKPLPTTERNTLLTIIAALCVDDAIDYKARGAATHIARLTEEIGAKVDADTVRRALSKTPDALESRKK
jgi:hypothetical protein